MIKEVKMSLKFVALVFMLLAPVIFAFPVKAVTIAEQTHYNEGSTLNVWAVLQELGTGLSGTVQKFTFRVSTQIPNNQQFDLTAYYAKIYDKSAGNSVVAQGCNYTSDPLSGLTFTTEGVPSGYEDVTIDFSCNNYAFVPTHRYLIFLSNGHQPQGSSLPSTDGYYRILFAAETSDDYFTGGGVRYAFDSGICYPAYYSWNSQTASYGCNIYGSSSSDLYFRLTNTDPDPTPTPTPSPTPSPTPTPTPTPEPTPTPSPTPSPTPEPTPTPTPTPTPSPAPTPTPTPTPTATPASTESSSSSNNSADPSPTPPPTPTSTPKPIAGRTRLIPKNTPTPTPESGVLGLNNLLSTSPSPAQTPSVKPKLEKNASKGPSFKVLFTVTGLIIGFSSIGLFISLQKAAAPKV